jgi:hypothetical protein
MYRAKLIFGDTVRTPEIIRLRFLRKVVFSRLAQLSEYFVNFFLAKYAIERHAIPIVAVGPVK